LSLVLFVLKTDNKDAIHRPDVVSSQDFEEDDLP